MINIFSRINNELASWITIWRFLRGLDCYGLQNVDGRTESSKSEQIKTCEPVSPGPPGPPPDPLKHPYMPLLDPSQRVKLFLS